MPPQCPVDVGKRQRREEAEASWIVRHQSGAEGVDPAGPPAGLADIPNQTPGVDGETIAVPTSMAAMTFDERGRPARSGMPPANALVAQSSA